MPKQVFYSFHFAKDVMRVQQIRNIGVIEDNKPVTPNDWEEVKRKGEDSIKKWIDENMKYKSCVVVLVGEETAQREWVQYEILKGWNDGKGVLGIHIHNIKCPNNGTCRQGPNPFENFTVGGNSRKMSEIVKCYNPNVFYPYMDISQNLEKWVDEAIAIRKNYASLHK